MKCTGETNLEGLRHPSRYRAQMNEQETLFAQGWDIVKNKVLQLTSQGIDLDKRGDKASLHNYKGANLYFYLIHLAIAIRSSLDPSSIGKKCNIVEWEDRLKCVDENLMCIGKSYNTEYKIIFNQLLLAFGLHRGNTECEEDCCIGIGEMIIGDNSCLALTIEQC